MQFVAESAGHFIVKFGETGNTVNLLFRNQSDVQICGVHISPWTSEDRGDNWLQEEGAVITAGTCWRFWVEPGLFDILARDCEGEDLERFNDVDFASDNRRWIPPQP